MKLIALLLSVVAVVALAGNRPAMYIFGDIHYDPFYGTSNNPVGGCSSGSPAFGTIKCDTPYALLESAIADVFSESEADTDGIFLMTGDFVRHNVQDFDNSSESGSSQHAEEFDIVANISETIASLIAQYSAQLTATTKKKRNIHVVAHQSAFMLAEGNEDCVPHYRFFTSTEPSMHPALLRLSDAMQSNGLISQEDSQQFKRCGFYSKKLPGTNLRVIAINTVIYSPDHAPSSINESDPCGQFEWLESELISAGTNNEPVMILGHIIPEVTKWVAEYLDTYRSLMVQYADVVANQWFGHTHMFTFLALSGESGFAPPLFDVPGITPRDGNMPSYLRVTFTDQTTTSDLNTSLWIVDEIHERYLDITNSPTSNGWQSGMKFPGDFNSDITWPLTSAGLYQYAIDLLEEKKRTNSWEQFQQFYFGGVVQTPMTKTEKTKILCRAISMTRVDYDNCRAQY